MKRIVIDPLTRLEGHGRVEIFLDEQGEVANAYLVVPELRGFEGICVGRPAYMNMNYHIEHHAIPMVPYHTLPKLHKTVMAQTPPPYTSLWQVYKEMPHFN